MKYETDYIQTQRLILRRFLVDDKYSVHQNWAADERIQHMYGEPVYATLDEVQGLLEKYISGYESENYHRWGIFSSDDNKCIGQIAFFLYDAKNNFAEIEYCVGMGFQGKGYATEATKAVIKFGFEQLGLHKIQISYGSINEKSKRVIEKCGLKYEATMRDYFYIDGEYIDRIYYSLLSDEYNFPSDENSNEGY